MAVSTKLDVAKINLVSQARSMMNKAEKKCRASIKNWKPHYSAAGAAFCHAALLLYQAGNEDEAKLSLVRASDCFQKKQAYYSAAKALEQAMSICIEQEDLSSMTELAWQSAALFRKAGQPDSAAELLERASTSLESFEPECSELMLEKAAETVETENRPIQAAWYVNKLLRLALKKQNVRQAISMSRKLIELYHEAGHKPSTGRSVLGLVLLLVLINSFREAELVAWEFGSNCTKNQNLFIEDLLDALDQHNEENLKKAKSDKCLGILDVEFKSIIDAISLPPQLGPRPRSRSRCHFGDLPKVDEQQEVEESNGPCSSDSQNAESNGDAEESQEDKDKKEESEPPKEFVVSSQSERPNLLTKPGRTEDPMANSHHSQLWRKLPGSDQSISHRSGRHPLQRSFTTEENTNGTSSSYGNRFRHQRRLFDRQRSNREYGPTAIIDVGSDNLQHHCPAHLPQPAVYGDVEGVDPLQPAYMGMTVEQWRAFKRQHQHYETNEAADNNFLAGIGEESVGDEI